MNWIGVIPLIAAATAAGYLMINATKPEAEIGGRNVTILKAVAWLGLAGALFAAKLFPLAFMILLAAGGITGIEIWRERSIRELEEETQTPPASGVAGLLGVDEAAQILGVDPTANADDIKAAHKKLIGQLHPDRGGSDYLAAKINDARSTLLAHKESSVAAPPSDESASPQS